MDTEEAKQFEALIFKAFHEMLDKINHPRTECMLEMNKKIDLLEDKMEEQGEKLEQKIDSLTKSVNDLTLQIRDVFRWKEEQEKLQRKIIGTLWAGGVSAVTYVLYSIFEHVKTKLGF